MQVVNGCRCSLQENEVHGVCGINFLLVLESCCWIHFTYYLKVSFSEFTSTRKSVLVIVLTLCYFNNWFELREAAVHEVTTLLHKNFCWQ